MLYQFTGQPGHGKTVLALKFAFDMKAKADKEHDSAPDKHPRRELYVCNVRDFQAGRAGAIDLKPEEVLTWHENAAFDNAIILIDEAYEHDMFPRRPPGRAVPEHIKQVAKHRHRGIDFILIAQSPKKQLDDFIHDLIEEHYHIRRRYGLPFVHVKRWDRYEPNPEKALPLTTTRKTFPKEIFAYYTSTKYDTSEKRVPWFYWAALFLVIVTVGGAWYAKNRVGDRFDAHQQPAIDPVTGQQANGAPATVATLTPATGAAAAAPTRGSRDDYLNSFMPRVLGQPWSAPAYDVLTVPSEPPRVFCALSGAGRTETGTAGASCTCITEQGTRYAMAFDQCATIARHGQYEPFLQPNREPIASVQPAQSNAPQSMPNTAVSSAEPSTIAGYGDIAR